MHVLHLWNCQALLFLTLVVSPALCARPADEDIDSQDDQRLELPRSAALLETGQGRQGSATSAQGQGTVQIATKASGFFSRITGKVKDLREPAEASEDDETTDDETKDDKKEGDGSESTASDADSSGDESDISEESSDSDADSSGGESQETEAAEADDDSEKLPFEKFPEMKTKEFVKFNTEFTEFLSEDGELAAQMDETERLAKHVKTTAKEWRHSIKAFKPVFQSLRTETQGQAQDIDVGNQINYEHRAKTGAEEREKVKMAIKKMEMIKEEAGEDQEDEDASDDEEDTGEESASSEETDENSEGGDATDEEKASEETDENSEGGDATDEEKASD